MSAPMVILATWLSLVFVQVLVNEAPTWIATATGAIVGLVGGFALASSTKKQVTNGT